MIVELACEKLGLDSKTSNIAQPENAKFWRNTKVRQWLEELVDPIVDIIFTAFREPSMDGVNMHIDTPSGAFDIVAPARLRGKHMDMLLNGNIAYLVFHMSYCSIAPQMEHSNLLYPPPPPGKLCGANFVLVRALRDKK